MRPSAAAWLRAALLSCAAASACSDRTGESSGSGGGGAGPEDGPSDEAVCGDAIVDPVEETCDDANGREGDGCNSDCRVSGERIWCLDDLGPWGSSAPAAMAVGPSGETAVIGTVSEEEENGALRAWLEVVDADGSARWSARFDGAAGIGVAFLPDGTLAAAIHEAGAPDSLIGTFSPGGARASGWAETPGRLAPRALAAGPGGSIVAAGDRGTAHGAEVWLETFSADLAPQGEAVYRSPLRLALAARGLAVDRSGTVLLGADVLLEPFESDTGVPPWGVAVAALRPSGDVVWERIFEPLPGQALLLASLAALPDGSVVATGVLQTGPISARAWTASASRDGAGWESVDEADGATGYGTSVSAASGPDFFRTRAASPDGSPAAAALFGRLDARGGTLWERERSGAGLQSHALIAAGSPADLSVLVAGSAAPVPAREPSRPWLCKHAE